MNLATLDVTPEAARAALGEYREAVAAAAEAELRARRGHHGSRRETADRLARMDAAILEGYKAIARGRPVLALDATIVAGGVDDRHRPRLAIARADEVRVRLRASSGGRAEYVGHGARPDAASRRFEVRGLPSWRAAGWTGPDPWEVRSDAIVPTIPPRIRPAVGQLDRYAILWEAEWSALPPRDPALLRPLGGGLFAVLAVWDLTPLERHVLGMDAAG